MSINRVNITGNLTRDPELRSTGSGMAVLQMGVAVNENPRFTEYLRYAERLGLGIADPAKIAHVRV